jgi:hypothetical protein
MTYKTLLRKLKIGKHEPNRQHNGLKKKDMGTNNDIQNSSQKTKDWET